MSIKNYDKIISYKQTPKLHSSSDDFQSWYLGEKMKGRESEAQSFTEY